MTFRECYAVACKSIGLTDKRINEVFSATDADVPESAVYVNNQCPLGLENVVTAAFRMQITTPPESKAHEIACAFLSKLERESHIQRN